MRRIVCFLFAALESLGCRESSAVKTDPPQRREPDPSPPITRSVGSETAVSIGGGPYALQGDLLFPEGAGPFPAVVYNHGSEEDPSLQRMHRTATWFIDNGFAVLFPYRRGTGGSEGPHWKDVAERFP